MTPFAHLKIKLLPKFHPSGNYNCNLNCAYHVYHCILSIRGIHRFSLLTAV